MRVYPHQAPLSSSTHQPGIAYPYPYSSSSYLRASATDRQPLCGNPEGWGPLSPIRWDFTPCFLDVWVLAVGVFGLLGGIGAVVYLRKQVGQPVGRDWHFWAKLVGL
jgi:hypothetical protein